MFSARCCQKAKKKYEKMNRQVAMRITYDAMKFISEIRSPPPPPPPPGVKALATFPIIREIEGRMAPASSEDMVPAMSRHLS